ncbi:MAG: disulfide bond formation protein B [Dokdonella sp.]
MTFNPLVWPFRVQYLTGAIVCAGLLGYALFEQYQMGVEPCPLCIFQRITFMAMGILFLIGAAHGPQNSGRRVYAVLVSIAAIAGIAVAARHLYLQSLPPSEVPDCGPGLGYMLDAFPLAKTLKMVFTGSGECAEVNWKFLGLAMPGWTLICYVALAVGAWWAAIRGRAIERSP